MIALRPSVTSKSSFNIGVAFVVDPEVTVLGDGITENEKLPKGETTVRTKTMAQVSIGLVASFTF